MALVVRLHGRAVGSIELESGNPVFRFAAEYSTHAPRAVLGRWFEDRVERLRSNFPHVGLQGSLPRFFSHYLPPAGSALRHHLARRAGVAEHREYDLLRELGEDLPGAVTVTGEGDDDAGEAVRDALVPESRPLRFSLAGIQLKFSLLRVDSHLVLPMTGAGGRWIVKLPDLADEARFYDVTQNEFAMMTWAKEAGITVPPCELVTIAELRGLPEGLNFRGTYAFATRRYDRRDDGTRIHQEDFAQVLNAPADADGKYGVGSQGANYTTLGNLILRLCGPEDFEEYLRRLVFMVLSANHDAHLKNWSIYYPDDARPRLAPAYDLVCTLVYADHPDPTKRLDTALALNLSRTKDAYEVTTDHFVRIASKVGSDPVRAESVVQETSARVRDAWAAHASSLTLPASRRAIIDAHLGKVKL